MRARGDPVSTLGASGERGCSSLIAEELSVAFLEPCKQRGQRSYGCRCSPVRDDRRVSGAPHTPKDPANVSYLTQCRFGASELPVPCVLHSHLQTLKAPWSKHFAFCIFPPPFRILKRLCLAPAGSSSVSWHQLSKAHH